MRRKWRRVSARMPPVTAWPDRLVPPERNVSGTPVRRAVAKSLPTSVASRGTTTACGVRTKCEASWA